VPGRSVSDAQSLRTIQSVLKRLQLIRPFGPRSWEVESGLELGGKKALAERFALAGSPDFRKLKLKAVANELSAGTKRKATGGTYEA
jgi:hypothetical protein